MKEATENVQAAGIEINNSNVGKQKIKWDHPHGMVFGKLTVLRLLRRGSGSNRVAIIECLCECGNIAEVRSCNLSSGNSTSCGCSTIKARPLVGKANKTHGMSYSSEYRIWHAMKGRCLNNKDRKYNRYGGRGIVICQRWLDSFENFYSDMGPRPSSLYSIDRINNDGNYELENCRWSIPKVQCNNRSNNIILQIGGLYLTAAQFSRIYGRSAAGIIYRKRKLGWNDRDAIFKQR
jgi:hypothetical protein